MRTLWCREGFWSASEDGLKHRTGWIRVGYSKTLIPGASVRECLIPLLRVRDSMALYDCLGRASGAGVSIRLTLVVMRSILQERGIGG